MRKAVSPLGQWVLRVLALVTAIAQGVLLLLYALVPKERSTAHKNPLVLGLELVATVVALAILPTFLTWLSFPDEADSDRKRVILFGAGLGAPLVAYLVLIAAL